MRLFRDADFHFIEIRRRAYVVSIAVMLAGFVAMGVNIAALGTWQNYGVDFTGGSLVHVRFDSEVTANDLRVALGGAQAPPITRFGDESEFVIRAPVAEDVTIEGVALGIETALAAALGEGSFEVMRTELVGATVGDELQQKAALAIIFSLALTMIYIAFRFELRFGLAAVIATLHDLIITLGFLAAFRVEISLPTVAAILTMLGYSLNDTIVVFDRIRENMGKKGARKRDQIELINHSINETLPRTVLTSGTTLAVLLSLLVLGGPVIRDFTIVLVLGVIIGTYSSVFVASPALLEVQRRLKGGSGAGKRGARRATG
jgi:preprotein translocase subunit SecF